MGDIFKEESLDTIDLSVFKNISKTALGVLSGAVVDRVASGDENALQIYIQAKALAEVANTIIKDTKSLALDEAEQYEAGEAKMLGCEFIVKNGVSRYSFDHDEEWRSIKQKIDDLQVELKARQDQMVNATKFAEVVDQATGEVIPPAELKSGGGSVLMVTIPK